MSGEPPDDAYGRVTDPQRYLVLHGALDELVAAVDRRFRITRSEGLHVDQQLASSSAGCIRVVRLEPADPGAAPITASWTTFPGVQLRLGRFHIDPFPSCGCDACDEDPGELIHEMQRHVGAVTDGRFREWTDRTRIGHAFEFADGARSSGWTLNESRTSAIAYTEFAWRPWPVRTV